MGKALILVAFLLVLVSIGATTVRADDYNKPEDNKTPAPVPAPKDQKPAAAPVPTEEKSKPEPPKEDEKPKPAPAPKEEKPKPSPVDDDTTNYDDETPDPKTGCERAKCKSKGACNKKTLTCPAECPERKPKKNKKNKGCFIHCGSKCEATCKCMYSTCSIKCFFEFLIIYTLLPN